VTGAERKLLREWAALVEEYIMPPRPSGGGDWDKQRQAFDELQRDRAIHISSDMRYLAGKSGQFDPGVALQIFTDRMRKELAEPLRYTVKPDAEGGTS
jgi:hypothetical protein